METLEEWHSEFRGNDLEDLSQATDEANIDGNGFGWLRPPERHKLETYWRGVLLVPQRRIVVARLDGAIVGLGLGLLPRRCLTTIRIAYS